MSKKTMFLMLLMLLFCTPAYAADGGRATEEEDPVLTESNWDQLPEADAPTDDITDFFAQFEQKEHVPTVVTPCDGDMLPDTANVHIRIDYDGSERCFAQINSTSSCSVLEIENNELIILSNKLVRGREYHLRAFAGNAYSDVVSFRIGNRYADEIERIIANTDIVAVGPRIDKGKIFPNGYFRSEEEADANMVTITVKVWRANTTQVEVEEEEIIDEIVKNVRVPVTRFLKDNEDDGGDGLFDYSVDGDDETDATEVTEEPSEATTDTVPDTTAADADEQEAGNAPEPSEETSPPPEEASETEEESGDMPEQPEDTADDADLPEYETYEEYTEITTVEYVTRTVTRTVNQGELYSSTMQITVNRALADTFKDIFDELYAIKFPIESAGCYNWRDTASGRISEHALGTAIDINPDQNYCVYGDGSSVGEYWRPYEDIYSVTPEVVNIFRKYNFSWGGSWITPKDYMHFSYFGT